MFRPLPRQTSDRTNPDGILQFAIVEAEAAIGIPGSIASGRRCSQRRTSPLRKRAANRSEFLDDLTAAAELAKDRQGGECILPRDSQEVRLRPARDSPRRGGVLGTPLDLSYHATSGRSERATSAFGRTGSNLGPCTGYLMSTSLTLLAVIALAATPLPAFETPGANPNARPKPNFLVIISDDQRPDTIAALGNRAIHTPHLDRLVREGMTFTRATCAFPLCVPSRAEILTGATAFRNGVPWPSGRLKKGQVFWADALRNAGYHTWYSGKWMNDGAPKTRGYEETSGLFSSGGAGEKGRLPRYGRKGRLITGYRGWTFKTNDGAVELEKGIGLVGETSKHIADGAIALLKRRPDKPFFLHVNFTAPHDPLVIPPGYAGKYDPAKTPLPANFLPRHPFDHGNFQGRDEKLLPWPRTADEIRDEIAAYYAVLDDMDAQIGRILQTLEEIGQYDNTVIIFSSDHGLALGSHGLMGKQNMYEHTIGVPFVIAGPGVPRGKSTRAQIYLRDMFPTTCELAGIPIPDSVQSKSIVPILSGQRQQIRSAVFGYFYHYQRMIRTDRWKLIRYPHLEKRQLFDLQNDPNEQIDLSSKAETPRADRSVVRQNESVVSRAGRPAGSGRVRKRLSSAVS